MICECMQFGGVDSLQARVKETCLYLLTWFTKFVAELLSGCFDVIVMFAAEKR